MLRLERTELALEDVKKHLEGLDVPNPRIENFLTQYLTVSFYSEMEEKVKVVHSQRIARKADDIPRGFAKNSNDSWVRRVSKSDISKLAKCFGDECKAHFNQALEDREISAYSNVICNRHAASHGLGGVITIREIEKGLVAASSILTKLKEAID